MSLFFKSVTFFILSFNIICPKVTSRPTGTGIRCPYNESEWNERAAQMFCQGSDSYHCFLTEDGVSVKESCIERTLILNGFCPIFTDEGYLHWNPCTETACPNSSYRSDEVHQYRICFGNTDKLIAESTDKGEEDSDSPMAIPITLGIGIPLLILVCVVVSYMCLCRKDQDKDVDNGVDVLGKKDILFIVGQLGNSVSTVGKEIASNYHDKSSSTLKCYNKSSWKFKCLNYLEVSPHFPFSDNTVYFIDGWFGLWNDNPCETGLVEKNLKIIRTVCDEKKKTKKFVLGIQSNVKDTYTDVFKRAGVNFSPSNTILRDSATTWKKQSIKSHLQTIKQNCHKSDCRCRTLKVDDILSIETLGTHLVLKLLDLDHSLADTMIDERKGPVDAMTEHFESLEKNDKDLFKGIMYIVLNGVYDDEKFDSEIAKEFSISREHLANENLQKYTKRIKLNDSQQQKSKISPTWIHVISDIVMERDTVHVFWHNFLYICAFRACYTSNPEKIMLHCNLDAILQLVRPKKCESEFTVNASDELITLLFNNRIKGKVFEEELKDHPLMQCLKK